MDAEMKQLEIGTGELLRQGADVVIAAIGQTVMPALRAAQDLAPLGIDAAVVNARFVKPLDRETILPLVDRLPFVITVEEGTLEGGFGSAVLEACNAERIDARNVIRLGLPDRFVEHAERAELMADLGLDVEGFCRAARRAFAKGREEDLSPVG